MEFVGIGMGMEKPGRKSSSGSLDGNLQISLEQMDSLS